MTKIINLTTGETVESLPENCELLRVEINSSPVEGTQFNPSWETDSFFSSKNGEKFLQHNEFTSYYLGRGTTDLFYFLDSYEINYAYGDFITPVLLGDDSKIHIVAYPKKV